MARITDSLAEPKALLAPVAALLVGVALLMLGNGLFLTLVPLRADLEGFGAGWIGAIGAAYSIGFVLGCYIVPPLVARVGHIRVYAAIAALGAIVPLLHVLALMPAAWIVFRVIIGLCISGLYMVIESWLNGASTRRNRGTVFSAYVAIHLAAVTAGQYLILLASPDSSELFSLATILFALAVIPVCLTRAPSPAVAGEGAAGSAQAVAQFPGCRGRLPDQRHGQRRGLEPGPGLRQEPRVFAHRHRRLYQRRDRRRCGRPVSARPPFGPAA